MDIFQEVSRLIEEARKANDPVLDLSGLSLTKLPATIGQLDWLQELHLYNNQLTSLPPEIGQLKLLQKLYLSNNQLTSLPPEIGQLQALQELYLYSNQLSSLPPEIGQLQALQEMHLSDNQLSSLPPEIGQLQALQELYLYNNQLSSLPPEIGQLKALREIFLVANPLRRPPLGLAQRGVPAIREYFKITNTGKRKAPSSALVINSGVAANYNAKIAEADALLVALRAVLHEDRQELVDSLADALKTNDQTHAPDLWDKIKAEVEIGTKAWPVLNKLGGLLGFLS